MKSTDFRPKFWFVILALTLGFSACTKKSRSPSLDTPEESAACGELNLVRDASWTAPFVKSFVSCLSEGGESDTGRKTFDSTLAVLQKLGDQALQSTLDMFQFEHDGKKVFFGLTTSLLNRGAEDQTDARWPETQKVLESTKPFAFLTLLMELKKRELLTPLLDALQSADDTLPVGFIETGVRQFLVDPRVKDDARVLIQAFLADPEVFQAFNEFLTPNAVALDTTCGDESPCAYEGSKELKSSAQHWLDFWSALSKDRRERLSLALSQVMKGTLEQDDKVALDRGHRLLNLAFEGVLRSDNVYLQLSEALDVLLKTPLSSYQPFIEGLTRIKDNPIYLDAFQEKMGASQLEDLVLSFLWKGGEAQTCSGSFEGLSSADSLEARRRIFSELLNPSPRCEGKTPVLVKMSELMGYQCSMSSCSIELLPNLAGSDYSALISYHARELRKNLAIDSYAYYRLGASLSELGPELAETLAKALEDAKLKSASDILSFEEQFARRYPKNLSKDWLTISLNQTLLKLSELEQNMKGLYPDRDPIEQWYNATIVDADAQMSRFAFGLYEGGATNQILSKVFSLESVETAWRKAYPKSRIERRELAQIIAPLRSSNSFMKNPSASFKPELEKISLPWSGSIKNQVSFSKAGELEGRGDLLSIELLFDQGPNGLSLLDRYIEQLPLATASVPTDEAEVLRRWLTEEFIPREMKKAKEIEVKRGEFPLELFERTPLSGTETRTLNLFLGTQLASNTKIPPSAKVSSTPESNLNPRNEAPRALYGAAAIGGSERPWTSFWLFQSSLQSDAFKNLEGIRRGLASTLDGYESQMSEKVSKPTLISQGLLDVQDADKLNAHEKVLVQLSLVSPILENRGKQFFVPSVGFGRYCPKKSSQASSWTESACPFEFADQLSYQNYLIERFESSFCAALPSDTNELQKVLLAMNLSDSAKDIRTLCSARPADLRMKKTSVESLMADAMALGKNPRLKSYLKGLPGELQWLKSQSRQDGKEALKEMLSYTPVLDGLTSLKLSQRAGLYQNFYSRLPGTSATWLLYLSRDIGLRGVAENLKRLGSQPMPDSENPVRDLLALVGREYDKALSMKASTLEFFLSLVTEIARYPYARETVMKIIGKPYDPYTGVLMGYTLPQAIDAGIFPAFAWETYAPLRLLLKNQNLDLLQGLGLIYDRDALDWLDHWLKISARFSSMGELSRDVEPILIWLKSFAASRDTKISDDLKTLVSLRDWEAPMNSATRLYRLLRVSLPDLSNKWKEAYYFQAEALTLTTLETLPKLLALKDRFESSGGDKKLMAEAFLGLIQGPLNNDSKELSLWLQDQRMGFRAPSFWGSALRDPVFRKNLDTAITGFESTNREDWRTLHREWVELAPRSHKLIDYMAKNLVPKTSSALYQKDALVSLADVIQNETRWQALSEVLESWLGDESVLKAWQDEYAIDLAKKNQGKSTKIEEGR